MKGKVGQLMAEYLEESKKEAVKEYLRFLSIDDLDIDDEAKTSLENIVILAFEVGYHNGITDLMKLSSSILGSTE